MPYECVNESDVRYMMEGWPVESLRCLETHIGLPGPGQSAVGVQDLTETSLLTVFHDDEELRAGSCRRRHRQNHVSLMFKTKETRLKSGDSGRSPSWTLMPNIRRMLGDSNRFMVSTSSWNIAWTLLRRKTSVVSRSTAQCVTFSTDAAKDGKMAEAELSYLLPQQHCDLFSI